jgi:hypothetical protein
MSEHETSSGSRDSDSGEERNGPGEQGPTRMLGDLEARVMQVVWAADKLARGQSTTYGHNLPPTNAEAGRTCHG